MPEGYHYYEYHRKLHWKEKGYGPIRMLLLTAYWKVRDWNRNGKAR